MLNFASCLSNFLSGGAVNCDVTRVQEVVMAEAIYKHSSDEQDDSSENEGSVVAPYSYEPESSSSSSPSENSEDDHDDQEDRLATKYWYSKFSFLPDNT
jgi:hypothetical protein